MPLEAYEIFDAATDTLIKELNLIKQKLAAGGHGDAAKLTQLQGLINEELNERGASAALYTQLLDVLDTEEDPELLAAPDSQRHESPPAPAPPPPPLTAPAPACRPAAASAAPQDAAGALPAASRGRDLAATQDQGSNSSSSSSAVSSTGMASAPHADPPRVLEALISPPIGPKRDAPATAGSAAGGAPSAPCTALTAPAASSASAAAGGDGTGATAAHQQLPTAAADRDSRGSSPATSDDEDEESSGSANSSSSDDDDNDVFGQRPPAGAQRAAGTSVAAASRTSAAAAQAAAAQGASAGTGSGGQHQAQPEEGALGKKKKKASSKSMTPLEAAVAAFHAEQRALKKARKAVLQMKRPAKQQHVEPREEFAPPPQVLPPLPSSSPAAAAAAAAAQPWKRRDALQSAPLSRSPASAPVVTPKGSQAHSEAPAAPSNSSSAGSAPRPTLPPSSAPQPSPAAASPAAAAAAAAAAGATAVCPAITPPASLTVGTAAAATAEAVTAAAAALGASLQAASGALSQAAAGPGQPRQPSEFRALGARQPMDQPLGSSKTGSDAAAAQPSSHMRMSDSGSKPDAAQQPAAAAAALGSGASLLPLQRQPQQPDDDGCGSAPLPSSAAADATEHQRNQLPAPSSAQHHVQSPTLLQRPSTPGSCASPTDGASGGANDSPDSLFRSSSSSRRRPEQTAPPHDNADSCGYAPPVLSSPSPYRPTTAAAAAASSRLRLSSEDLHYAKVGGSMPVDRWSDWDLGGDAGVSAWEDEHTVKLWDDDDDDVDNMAAARRLPGASAGARSVAPRGEVVPVVRAPGHAAPEPLNLAALRLARAQEAAAEAESASQATHAAAAPSKAQEHQQQQQQQQQPKKPSQAAADVASAVAAASSKPQPTPAAPAVATRAASAPLVPAASAAAAAAEAASEALHGYSQLYPNFHNILSLCAQPPPALNAAGAGRALATAVDGGLVHSKCTALIKRCEEWDAVLEQQEAGKAPAGSGSAGASGGSCDAPMRYFAVVDDEQHPEVRKVLLLAMYGQAGWAEDPVESYTAAAKPEEEDDDDDSGRGGGGGGGTAPAPPKQQQTRSANAWVDLRDKGSLFATGGGGNGADDSAPSLLTPSLRGLSDLTFRPTPVAAAPSLAQLANLRPAVAAAAGSGGGSTNGSGGTAAAPAPAPTDLRLVGAAAGPVAEHPLRGRCNLWNVMWCWSSRVPVPSADLLVWSKINHFPEARHLTRKDLLKRLLTKYQTMHGHGRMASLFNFIPVTFTLPKEAAAFGKAFARAAAGASAAGDAAPGPTTPGGSSSSSGTNVASNGTSSSSSSRNIWILKPVGSSRGRGISLIDDIEALLSPHGGGSGLRPDEPMVVQRYISNPLTLRGYKFDLRLYVLVESFNPLEAWLYGEGFARFATVPYRADSSTLADRHMHLTNSAVQKERVAAGRAPDFLKRSEPCGGAKVSLQELRRLLAEERGVEWAPLWQKVVEVVQVALFAARDEIPFAPNSFELFGVDVLIDDDLKVWLIEVNSSPSMSLDTPLDRATKPQLIRDVIGLVDPVPFDRRALLAALRARYQGKGRLSRKGGGLMAGTAAEERELTEADLAAVLGGALPRRPGEPPRNPGRFERIAPAPLIERLSKLKKPIS